MLGAISHIGTVAITSKGPGTGTHPAYEGLVVRAAGINPVPVHSVHSVQYQSQALPMIFEDDERRSFFDLYEHLTFDNKGAITDIAPSLAHFCARAYAATGTDPAAANSYFRGRSPHVTEYGSWATLFKQRLRPNISLDAKAKVCTHPAHTGPRVVSATDAELPIQVFKRALCPTCMRNSNSRHRPPDARMAGAGYLRTSALKTRTQPDVWAAVFFFIDTLAEPDILAGCLDISRERAVAIITRPLEAIACLAGVGRTDARAHRILALIAHKPTKRISNAVGVVASRNTLGTIVRQNTQLWTAGITRTPPNSIHRKSAAISTDYSALYFLTKDIVMENTARRVLRAIIVAPASILTIQLAANTFVSPQDVFVCGKHIGPPPTLRLAQAHAAAWVQIEAVLNGGHITGTLTPPHNTPFAILVEAAMSPHIHGITLAPTYLPPQTLLPGDIAAMAQAEAFLANPPPDLGSDDRVPFHDIVAALSQ